MATDGKGGYREALLARWGQVPEYARRGRPASRKQAHPDWHYLQVIKHGSGHRLISVTIKVVYGTPNEVVALVGAHTVYVERTNLTSRQMKGRLVRKALSYSKQLEMLEAACSGMIGSTISPDPSRPCRWRSTWASDDGNLGHLPWRPD